MPTLNRKLRQLLTEFMAIGIEEPSIDLKRKVARMFVGEEGLPSSVIDQIASKPGLNLKKIETIVNELLTYKRLGERIDENLLNKVVGAFIEVGK
jgi:chromosomal replication initiation ATPase DnaA